MDKMGSSSKAGNKGIPATSRNGAPIEMTAILKNCLDFIISLQKEGYIKTDFVLTKSGKKFKILRMGKFNLKKF